MESFLWFVLWAVFVLPVAKCFAVGHSTPNRYKSPVRDWVIFSLLWPLTVPGFIIVIILAESISKVFGKLIDLFED